VNSSGKREREPPEKETVVSPGEPTGTKALKFLAGWRNSNPGMRPSKTLIPQTSPEVLRSKLSLCSRPRSTTISEAEKPGAGGAANFFEKEGGGEFWTVLKKAKANQNVLIT